MSSYRGEVAWLTRDGQPVPVFVCKTHKAHAERLAAAWEGVDAVSIEGVDPRFVRAWAGDRELGALFAVGAGSDRNRRDVAGAEVLGLAVASGGPRGGALRAAHLVRVWWVRVRR